MEAQQGNRPKGNTVTLIPSPRPTTPACPYFPFEPPENPLDLPAAHTKLQQRAPLSKVRLPSGQADTEAWLVTGHAEALRVYRDSETFLRGPADGVSPFIKAHPIIIALDGDEHRRVRGLVKSAFSPAKVARLRPMVKDTAAELLDRLIAKGEPGDLSEDFAMPLTLSVIGGLFGIPEEDYPQFRRWSESLISVSPDSHRTGPAAMQAMVGYMAALIQSRGQNPGDDLVSLVAVNAKLANADPSSAGLLAASLVAGGWESTGGALVCSTHRLLTTSGTGGASLYSRLCTRPALIPTAVEEMLRVVPNSVLGATQPRRATRDIELGGVLVRAGELLIPSPDSAARDPRVFTDTGTVDLERTPNPHLAFGSGAHVCIGAPLGRLQLQVALELLTQRMPSLRPAIPAEDLEWRWDASVIRRPTTYPVAWSRTRTTRS